MKKFLVLIGLVLVILVMDLSAKKLKIYKNNILIEEHLFNKSKKTEINNIKDIGLLKIFSGGKLNSSYGKDNIENIKFDDTSMTVFSGISTTNFSLERLDSVVILLGVVEKFETVTIGTQVWMKKNLDISTYRNGDIIPQVTDATQWANLTTGAWCYINNYPVNGAIYGKLYNWYAVNDPRGLAPSGYHVPSDAEWTTLENYLSSNSKYWCNKESVNIAKSFASKEYWLTTDNTCAVGNNLKANNSSGFSALPGGYRNNNGSYDNISSYGYWWSSTVGNVEACAKGRYLIYSIPFIAGFSIPNVSGFSVRCVRD